MTEKTCYALVLYVYDYYEYEETFAVSFSQGKLRSELASLNHHHGKQPFAEDDNQHRSLARSEEHHWTIKPIKFLA